MGSEGFIQDPAIKETKRFHRDKKSWVRDPKVFVDHNSNLGEDAQWDRHLCLRSPRSRLRRRQPQHWADRRHYPRHPLKQRAQRAKNSCSALAAKENSSVIKTLLSSRMPSGNRTRPHFLRISEVIHRVGVSRATIYRWKREGTSPKQIAIGANSIVWLESDVTQGMDQRIVAG